MLIHVVVDYGHGDLAFAEAAQRLCLNLPGATLVLTPVPAFDTVSAGFCVGQLALTPGPAERVVFHNVAPRADTADPRPGNQGERLVCARLGNGVLVVGVNGGYTFSFLRDEALTLHEVQCSTAGSQFRLRDFFPQLLARVLAGEENALGEPLSPDAVAELPKRPSRPPGSRRPWPPDERVEVTIAGQTATATVTDGTFEVAASWPSLLAARAGLVAGPRHFASTSCSVGAAALRSEIGRAHV
jgi:hypothetical protein